MSDFECRLETVVNASPEAVFGIVSDLTRHKELAGSGELVKVRKLTEGPTGLGSMIEADERIELGDQVMEFPAKSVVVAYEAPKVISWMPSPPVPTRRVQWWFRLAPEGQGTKLMHEVEVDLGDAADMFGGLDAYKKTRGVDVANGMGKTLQNVKAAAEKK